MGNDVPFRDVVTYAIGGGWGSQNPIEGGVPVSIIRGTDFAGLQAGNAHDVPRRYEGKAKAEKRTLRPGDVVLEISGGSPTSGQSTGRTLLVKDSILADLGGRVIPASFCRLVRFDGAKVDPRYAYYSLQDMYVSGRAAEYEHRSTGISNFQFEYFLDHETIRLVPLGEQRVIGHILGTLDDKIELNRRMNETLEAMARALFKSWFVDFDHVRAKAEGRPEPGLRKPIVDLFPSRFEDSELGEIPEGWGVGRLRDLVGQFRDSENPQLSPEALFSHYSIPAYDDQQQPKLELGNRILSLKWRVPSGAILLSKLNPEIERVWLTDLRQDEHAVCSTEFLVLQPRSPTSTSYAYCLARSPTLRRQLEGLVTGTSKSHQRANADAILNLPVIIPPTALIKEFEGIVGNLLGQVLNLRRESRTLATLRNTLLPKLISGELRLTPTHRLLQEIGA